ncbi:MAG: hypothetical protein KC620_23825, partial [Myxococcales bacterium]|nr:hypothetical protein [Myxococcales bacterium]
LLVAAGSAEQWLALLGQLGPRTTLVFAADSNLVRAADRERQAAALDDPARVVLLRGGHHLPLSAPEAIADLVLGAINPDAEAR